MQYSLPLVAKPSLGVEGICVMRANMKGKGN